MDDRPIGVFDSGFGGPDGRPCVDRPAPRRAARLCGRHRALPVRPAPRRGGAALQPRDHRPPRARRGNVKMVVVACNTAASAALDELRFSVDVPVVGVIEPGLRVAAQATATGRIGVIGTVGTVASGAYQRRRRRSGSPGGLTSRRARDSSSSSSGGRPTLGPGPRPRRALARARSGGGRRRPAPRLYALPVPRAHDRLT